MLMLLLCVNAGWILFIWWKPIHTEILSDSVLEQRDPKLQVRPEFFVIQGVPIEHGWLSEFLQTRLPELALDSPPGFLLLREPPLLPRFSAESREARQRLELCRVRGPELQQLRHRSARRSRLVQGLLQRPEHAGGLVPPIQPGLLGSQGPIQQLRIERKRGGPGFQWLRHWLHRPFRRVREVRLNQCRLDFLGKVREGFLEKVKQGNQTKKEKEKA